MSASTETGRPEIEGVLRGSVHHGGDLALCLSLGAAAQRAGHGVGNRIPAHHTAVNAPTCRDFAHLGITFCRALDIPARLAVGYSMFDTPPPDFHAMFEAYVVGHWQLFDPTRMSSPEQMVRIAVGRDAKDVAFSTIFGAAQGKLILPCIKPA